MVVVTDTEKIPGRSNITPSAEALSKDRRGVEFDLELIAIYYGLASRWKMIVAFATAGLICVSTYLWFKPDIYEVKAYSLPPLESRIQSLRYPMLIARHGMLRATTEYPWLALPPIPEINVDLIHIVFGQKLTSPGLQSRYAEEHGMSSQFRVSLDGNTYALILYSDQPDQAIEWVKGFAQHASDLAIRDIASQLQHVIDNRIKIIERAERVIRNVNNQYRLDLLVQLKEALDTAEKLGIVDRIVDTPLRSEDVPLYYRGTTMLSAEIEAVQNREGNDAFAETPQIRELQEWAELHRNISIKTKDVDAARYDRVAANLIKTNTSRLVILAILLGLVVGVITAFFAYLMERYRATLSSG